MWIALREGHSVWKLDLKVGTLAHIAGSGKKGFTGDGAAAKAGHSTARRELHRVPTAMSTSWTPRTTPSAKLT